MEQVNYNPDMHLHLWDFVLVILIGNLLVDATRWLYKRLRNGKESDAIRLEVNWPKGKVPTDDEFRTIREALGDAFLAQTKQERARAK